VPRRFSQTIVFEKVRRIGIAATELTANLGLRGPLSHNTR
jgi:hypothetical protein